MAALELTEIVKTFEERSVVSDVSLSVSDGEFVAILGPSGCGKSTLLRIIAGLEHATSGQISLGGRDTTWLHPKDRDIAMVFQNYALYPHLSIFENIAFPLRIAGTSKRELGEAVQRVAALVGISHLLARKPRQLSGGERQRAALARALIRKPALFLLDEPLSNLDAKLRQSAREELKLLQKKTGLTALYVTHDQVEAMGLGDRIVVMNAGVIRQVGTPEDIYRYPADTFVATFIGTPPMNIIESQNRLIGFRPETVQVNGQASGDKTAFPVEIQRSEYLGNVQLIYALITGPFKPERVIAAVPVKEAVAFVEGEKAEFVVPSEELRFFYKNTGLAFTNSDKIPSPSISGEVSHV